MPRAGIFAILEPYMGFTLYILSQVSAYGRVGTVSLQFPLYGFCLYSPSLWAVLSQVMPPACISSLHMI